MTRTILRVGSSLVLPAALLAATLVPGPREPQAAAQPVAKPLTAELTYVPRDAAVFIHANASKLWNGPLVKSIRTADPNTLDELIAGSEFLFGSKPDALETLTMFWPKLKMPEDPAAFGVVAVFKTPYDKTKLKAGFEKIVEPRTKVALVEVSPQIAVLLAGLDPATYGKPQPDDKKGPLEAAIREAGTGRHLLTLGVAPGNLPDEIRRDDLPAEVRAFQPLFHAESITAAIDFDKEIAVDIQVKSSSPPRAKEAEKALGFLTALAADTLGQGIKELGKAGEDEPGVKDIVSILSALQTGVKEAKFSTEGEVTRVTARAPADLKFAQAFIAGKRKVQEAAARAQSSNNLKQIVLALHNYHDTFNAFPPAAVCDKTGKPVLSWRVLILPYIEQDNLYKQFKLDEPWDSENNKKLIAKMPRTYLLPNGAKATETHYRAFVGNGAVWDYLKGSKLSEITDGSSNTLMVVTAKDSVIWSKPDELDFDPDKDMTKLLGYHYGNVCMVALGDGSVRAFSNRLGRKNLNLYIQKNDGQVVSDDDE